ncbi:hypothetical protein AB4254_12180 [Vibrio breoganii]
MHGNSGEKFLPLYKLKGQIPESLPLQHQVFGRCTFLSLCPKLAGYCYITQEGVEDAIRVAMENLAYSSDLVDYRASR